MSHRPNPEELLGGYATGTLTPEERELLLQAALRDQALFDALMDEEILRELLADPRNRKRLLAVLSPRRPLLRRPQVLAMAAGLLVVVATVYTLERAKPMALPTIMQGEPRTERQSADPVPLAGEPHAAPRQKKATGDRGEPKAAGPSVRFEEAAKPEASAPAKSMDAEGARAAGAPTGPMAPAKRKLAAVEPASALKLRLERMPGGLRVFWSGEGHLYVLRRGPGRVQVIRPSHLADQTGTFLFALGEGEVVDVYLLHKAVEAPESLTAEGPVEGVRRRVEP